MNPSLEERLIPEDPPLGRPSQTDREGRNRILKRIWEEASAKGSRAERESHRRDTLTASEPREKGRCGKPWKRNIRETGPTNFIGVPRSKLRAAS